ncbi:MAG: hypothetical protein AAFY72_08105 [Cyanobacteria bacterium J06649_4]
MSFSFCAAYKEDNVLAQSYDAFSVVGKSASADNLDMDSAQV